MTEKKTPLILRFRRELKVYQNVMRDSRTPWLARVLLAVAVAYVLSPFDLIPDFIPVLGHVDDVIIVPLLIWLSTRMVPKQVLIDARSAVDNGRSV